MPRCPRHDGHDRLGRVESGEVKAGDVVSISGAAGAVGNVAGQLAKLRGCRVIGSAGSREKVRFLRAECGFAPAFDYKAGPVLEQLNLKAPNGLDVYFDDVGGETLEAALSALRVHGRIIVCGGISGYNGERPRPGPSHLFMNTRKTSTVEAALAKLVLLEEGQTSIWQRMLRACGGALSPLDLLAIGALNRSAAQCAGFRNLVQAHNFLCATSILRLQLDTALRFYAAFLVQSRMRSHPLS